MPASNNGRKARIKGKNGRVGVVPTPKCYTAGTRRIASKACPAAHQRLSRPWPATPRPDVAPPSARPSRLPPGLLASTVPPLTSTVWYPPQIFAPTTPGALALFSPVCFCTARRHGCSAGLEFWPCFGTGPNCNLRIETLTVARNLVIRLTTQAPQAHRSPHMPLIGLPSPPRSKPAGATLFARNAVVHPHLTLDPCHPSGIIASLHDQGRWYMRSLHGWACSCSVDRFRNGAHPSPVGYSFKLASLNHLGLSPTRAPRPGTYIYIVFSASTPIAHICLDPDLPRLPPPDCPLPPPLSIASTDLPLWSSPRSHLLYPSHHLFTAANHGCRIYSRPGKSDPRTGC